MIDKSVRKKPEILETLPRVVSDSDKKLTNSMYRCSGSLIKNEFQTVDNPATYVGWSRTDRDEIQRMEAEPRHHKDGKITMSMKTVTVPPDMAVELGLAVRIPDYQGDRKERESQQDFFTQT